MTGSRIQYQYHPSAHRLRDALITMFGLCAFAVFLTTASAASGSGHMLHGFFDIEFEIGDKDDIAKKGTFDQHHLTLIRRTQIDDRIVFLFEASYEHGPTLSGSAAEGKIYIPKAYVEIVRSDALQFRIGKFLPPFGIYNARHDATPTLLPTVLPSSVYGKHQNLTGALSDSLSQKVRAYPRFATGAWMLGSYFTDSWDFEYSLYLTNGRGTASSEKDDNFNKGVGGRIVIGSQLGVRCGVSYYTDQNGSVGNAKQSALGTDIEYTHDDLTLESGMVFPRFEILEADGTRSNTFTEPFGYYVMAGYTVWGGTTFFSYFDHYDPDRGQKNDLEIDRVIGVNQQIGDSVFLKGELHWRDHERLADSRYNTFISSLAVAF